MKSKGIFIALVFLTGSLTSSAKAAEARRITVTEAVQLALRQNRSLKIARLRVAEHEQKRLGTRSAYFPTISNQSNLVHSTELENVVIPAGALGVPAGFPVPSRSLELGQGQNTVFSSGTAVTQPITQLIRIRAANRAAAAEVATSREELKKAENQVALQVHALYYGVLIARLQKQAAAQQSVSAGEHLREAEEDIRNGSALKVAAIQGRAGLLESQQAELTADLQISDLTTELNDLLGLPLDTQLELDPGVPAKFEAQPREEFVRFAWTANPEILAAEEAVKKARAGITAAKSAYLPDVTAYARQHYQNGVPFLVHNFGSFGVLMNWELFDFGKRRAAVRERQAQLAQAEENLERLKEHVAVGIEKSYSKLERTRNLVGVAKEVVKLRQETERLAQNQFNQGVVLVSEKRQATAGAYKAQADYLQASLGYLLAWAELEQAAGRTPGLP